MSYDAKACAFGAYATAACYALNVAQSNFVDAALNLVVFAAFAVSAFHFMFKHADENHLDRRI